MIGVPQRPRNHSRGARGKRRSFGTDWWPQIHKNVPGPIVCIYQSHKPDLIKQIFFRWPSKNAKMYISAWGWAPADNILSPILFSSKRRHAGLLLCNGYSATEHRKPKSVTRHNDTRRVWIVKPGHNSQGELAEVLEVRFTRVWLNPS